MYSDFTTLYNENMQRATCIPYFLVCKEGELDFKLIKEKMGVMDNEVIVDLKEKYPDENVYIPDIFNHEGKVILKNKVERVNLLNNSLFITVTADYIQRNFYRDQDLLTR